MAQLRKRGLATSSKAYEPLEQIYNVGANLNHRYRATVIEKDLNSTMFCPLLLCPTYGPAKVGTLFSDAVQYLPQGC